MANSLIITLKIEEEAQSFFEKKRSEYYPRHCNYVPAHITFFHALPNSSLFLEGLHQAAPHKEVTMDVASILSFNNGMAYELKNEQLQILHSHLQKLFLKELSGKDKKIWSPHITVQNKVTEFKAQKSCKELLQYFKPFSFKVEGFNVYVYEKKRWNFNLFIPFAKL